MVTEFKLPELGEGIDGGDVIEVLVADGDQVDEGQTLLELETAKATIPVPAPHAGRVAKVHVKAGDHVQVGQPLVTLDGDTDAAAATSPKAARTERAGSPKTADPHQAQRAPASRSADEKRPSAEKSTAGTPPAEHRPQPTQKESPAHQPRLAEKAPAAPAELPGDLVPAGPATRRLARELGVDLHLVTGTGPGDRITEDDIKAYVRQLASSEPSRATPGATSAADRRGIVHPTPALPDFSRWGPVDREPLNSVRRTTAEHLSLAWHLIPHVTHFDEADVTEWEQFRKRHSDRAAARGAKLTVTALALKAAAVALRALPQFNSSLDSASGELILKRYYHIGVAVDTERGLVVPVIRDVDKKSLLDLATELASLADRARQKKLKLEDMQGGTFTITNLGGLGGVGFSPIVNWPEVAILGLARAREQQVIRGGQPEIRLMLPLCLSYDHRVIDGAAAARFTRRLAELLEDLFLMVLEI
jgi:pyruvate dehydrogenase E2 component (dihydrolipoamide acetyltransferase)